MSFIGQRFGRYVVKTKETYRYYTCECDCGSVKKVSIYHLKDGKIQSCGCFHKEELTQRNSKHSMSHTPEYSTWSRIKSKTTNPDDEDWYLYGARGIKMSDEFFSSFENFYNYMGPRPIDGQRYSVGRLDNDKGYERGNMRWETDIQQAQNKRKISTNKSGVTGVSFRTREINGKLYSTWTASWIPISGKGKRSKDFSADKFGYDEAFRLAVEYRNKMIALLNANGAHYSEKHGK